MENSLYDYTLSLIALSTIKGIGRRKIRILVDHCENPAESNYLSFVESGVDLNIFSRMTPVSVFLDAREKARDILDICAKNDIRCMSSASPDFPPSLNYDDGPNLIYYKGDLDLLTAPHRAASIGTRVPTETGSRFSYSIGRRLAENGVVVVSGLATGCDAESHTGCLDAGGKTVAFLPSNLVDIIPKYNVKLAERIIDNGGCLISEFSPMDVSNAFMFVERDRLQAHVSDYVFVSEFEKNSGTLQTLKFASSYGKPIVSNDTIMKTGVTGFSALDSEKIDYSVLPDAQIDEFIAGKCQNH